MVVIGIYGAQFINMIGFIPFALPFELNLQTGSAYIGDDWKFEF